jgi:tetratricopeptide (TPR) repeat protein
LLFAHGDLHEAIARVSSRIEKDPQDVFLYFERGMLYQEHEELEAALADYERVLTLEPDFHSCLLQMAQIHLLRNQPSLALSQIEEYLNKEPANPFAYKTRAEIRQRLGEHQPAVADLRTMILLKNENAIRPEDYFQLSGAILQADPGNHHEAIGALEAGIDRLGPVISLQSRLVDLEVLGGRYAAALARIDRVMVALPVRKTWLQKKAEILELAGRPADAAQALEQARAETEKTGKTGQVRWAQKPLTATGDALTLGRLSAQTVVRGPYLQSGSPQSMTVKWRTDGPTNSKIWFGTDLAHLDQSLTIADSRIDHELTLTGLSADTKYYYAIGDDAGYLAGGDHGHFFRTPPMPGAKRPVRAWVLGDCGTGDERARAVRDGYYAYADTNFTDLVLLLGDNAYDDGTDAEYQRAMFENMYEDQLIHSVLWPTPGNHDYRSADAASQTGPYFDIFTVPKQGEAGGLASGTEAYYSFDYANIHFISLDSHDSGRNPGDPMLVWLENDLNATGQDWIVVFFHHPPYSKGSHDSDKEDKLIEMRENVLPILEARGVDLVLSGHSHSYERSYLMHGHYGRSSTLQPEMIVDRGNGRLDDQGAYEKYLRDTTQSKGQVYITAGSSGKIGDGKFNHPVMYYSAPTLGSLSLEVSDQRLDLKFIGVEGEALDYFTIQKQKIIGAPPTVSVTLPVANAFVPSPRTIPVEARALDTDGFIRQVIFFADGDTIGRDDSAPYAAEWTIPADGKYRIEAAALDNDGNFVKSEVIHVNVGRIGVCAQINDTNDDAEESSNGRVDLNSSDLEMIDDPGSTEQIVGLRFTDLGIPRGAIIHEAFLQFTVEDDNDQDPCELMIYGEAKANPPAFSKVDLDLSQRSRTDTSVNWTPEAWPTVGAAGPAQRTPDLSAILQEIVNQADFSTSSPVVFLISGAGRRTAESFDGDEAAAPRICIEYSLSCTLPDQLIATLPDTLCGPQDVALTAAPAAGYRWNTGDTTAVITAMLSETTPYTLMAWDDNGCLKTDSIEIIVAPGPEFNISGDTLLCAGELGLLSVSQPFSRYLWSDGSNEDTLVVTSPGAYALTVTDQNGCEAADTVTVRMFDPVEAGITGKNTFCPGGQTILSVAGSFVNYAWSDGSESSSLIVRSSGTYAVTVTDENGCQAAKALAVATFDTLSAIITGDTIFCPGDQSILSLTDSFSQYHWSNGVEDDTAVVRSPGVYGVTVTDLNGCMAEDSLTVKMFEPVQVSIRGDRFFCPGGQSILSISESFSGYQWSTGSTNDTLVATTPGDYGVTVADENGCTAEDLISISVLDTVVANLAGDTLFCEGEQGKLFLTAPFTSYQWATGVDTDTLWVDTPGSYSVTVTAENGCTGEDRIEVLKLQNPNFSFETDSIFFCRGEAVEIQGPEGFATYEWSSGELSRSVTVGYPDRLFLFVKDQNGCSAVDTIETIERPVPDVFLEMEGDTLKNAMGPGPEDGYQYLWSTGDTTTTIPITASGDYCLTVVNSFGCAAEDCIELLVNSEDSTVHLFPWRVYPNPFHDQLTIGPADGRRKLEVVVFDLLGRNVPVRVEDEREQFTVWFGGLPAGVYLLAVKDGGVTSVTRVIKR